MDKKKIRKFFEILFLYPLATLVLLLVKILPLAIVLAIGRGLGFFAYSCIKRHRDLAFETIKTAIGKTGKEAKNIVKTSFVTFAEHLVETLYYAVNKKSVYDKIDIVGEEHLLSAIKKDKGIICVSAHMGCFPLLMYRLQSYNVPTNLMLRPLRNNFFHNIVDRLMNGLDVVPVYSKPPKKAIIESLKALKKKEMLLILNDQNYGTGGVWVDFFGKLAATAVGAVALAKRSGAVLLPMYMVRNKAGRHTLVIEPEFELKDYDNPDEQVLENVALLTKRIESWIVKYPQSWSWMHRRWKSRPDSKDLSVEYRVQGND